MATELRRAYLLPGEYCVTCRYKASQMQFRSVTEELLKVLPHRLGLLKKGNLPLLELLGGGKGDAFFIDADSEVRTIVSPSANDVEGDTNATVIIRKRLPENIFDIEHRYEENSDYLKLRLEVLESVNKIYTPNPPRKPTEDTNAQPQELPFTFEQLLPVMAWFDNQDYATALEVICSILRGEKDELEQPVPLQIVSISPNWMLAANSNPGPPPIDTGGPGALPVPLTTGVPAANELYKFEQVIDNTSTPTAPGWWEESAPGSDPVYVGILDTARTAQEINDAVADSRSSKLLVQLVGAGGLSPAPAIGDLGEIHTGGKLTTIYTRPDGLMPDTLPATGENIATAGHNYDMTDHGLFISGIVNSIEPEANICLVQVLNKYGVGNLETVYNGLRDLWTYWTSTIANSGLTSTRFAINLSLAFDAPYMADLQHLIHAAKTQGTSSSPEFLYLVKLILEILQDEAFQAYWERESAKDPSLQQIPFLFQFVISTWQTFSWFHELLSNSYFGIKRGDLGAGNTNIHVMLAAAGNARKVDSSTIPPTGFPASEPDVVGVGAASKSTVTPDTNPPNVSAQQRVTGVTTDDDVVTQDPAKYSSSPDAPPQDGYYVFGGEANGQPAKPADPAPKTEDGIIGLYIGSFPDPNDPADPSKTTPSTNGFGLWAGTSFATPILTGVVAALLRRGDINPLGTLKSKAASIQTPDGINSKVIPVVQVLR